LSDCSKLTVATVARVIFAVILHSSQILLVMWHQTAVLQR